MVRTGKKKKKKRMGKKRRKIPPKTTTECLLLSPAVAASRKFVPKTSIWMADGIVESYNVVLLENHCAALLLS